MTLTKKPSEKEPGHRPVLALAKLFGVWSEGKDCEALIASLKRSSSIVLKTMR